MQWVIKSFDDAKSENLDPPWGCQSWSEVEDQSWDFDYLSGIWQIEDGGASVYLSDDAGDAEDQTLTRNWAWVADALNAAYAQGVIDGTDAGLRVKV